MSAYYNEHDPFAAAWLRELIKAGQIAPGEVDERSIEDVLPMELREFTQCHFFAGIGVWSYALRQAGWPDDRAVWTGSCPCQPFSAAGKRGGVADERHLWPALYYLIDRCTPPVFFGEQVSSKDGLAWFDTVHTDLEKAGYGCGAFDLCSAGFGAPHIRQRLYFVADSLCSERWAESQGRSDVSDGPNPGRQETPSGLELDCKTSGLAHTDITVSSQEREQRSGQQLQPREDEGTRVGMAESECRAGWEERENAGRCGEGSPTERLEQRSLHSGDSGGLANNNTRLEGRQRMPERAAEQPAGPRGLVNGFWREAEWIYCRDGKYRPIEPGSSPLATGITNRVGKLRGYGNALTAEVAKGFIEAYLEVEQETSRG